MPWGRSASKRRFQNSKVCYFEPSNHRTVKGFPALTLIGLDAATYFAYRLDVPLPRGWRRGGGGGSLGNYLLQIQSVRDSGSYDARAPEWFSLSKKSYVWMSKVCFPKGSRSLPNPRPKKNHHYSGWISVPSAADG